MLALSDIHWLIIIDTYSDSLIQYTVEDGKQLGVDYFSGYYSSMMTFRLVQFYRFTLCALALVSLEVKGKRIRVRIFRLLRMRTMRCCSLRVGRSGYYRRRHTCALPEIAS